MYIIPQDILKQLTKQQKEGFSRAVYYHVMNEIFYPLKFSEEIDDIFTKHNLCLASLDEFSLSQVDRPLLEHYMKDLYSTSEGEKVFEEFSAYQSQQLSEAAQSIYQSLQRRLKPLSQIGVYAENFANLKLRLGDEDALLAGMHAAQHKIEEVFGEEDSNKIVRIIQRCVSEHVFHTVVATGLADWNPSGSTLSGSKYRQ